MDHSLPKRIGLFFALICAVIAVLLISWRLLRSGDSDKAKDVRDSQGIAYVLANLNNPASASFSDVSGPCGRVSYTDLFGQKTDSQRYVALGPDSVLIDRNIGASRFNFVWKQFCSSMVSHESK